MTPKGSCDTVARLVCHAPFCDAIFCCLLVMLNVRFLINLMPCSCCIFLVYYKSYLVPHFLFDYFDIVASLFVISVLI